MNAKLASSRSPHIPVLYHEIIHVLKPHSGGFYIDGTLGAGGHAWGILDTSAPDGRLLGFDVDPRAISLAKERLASFGDRVVIVNDSYTNLTDHLRELGWDRVDGILFDLGVSSMQLEDPERGFSFQRDAPLDMRFSPEQRLTAAELLNTSTEDDLADLIFRYGEERKARQCARAIVAARPIQTAGQLAKVIRQSIAKGYETRIDPATRTFQAIRMAVNAELTALETVLPLAVAALAPEGRLAVIAFHSLEDRLVKQFMRRESRDCLCPARQPVCTCGHRATIKEITRHPTRPQAVEVQDNPRARSARLRVAEKLA